MEDREKYVSIIVGREPESIAPERIIANFLYVNKVTDISFPSFFREFQKELHMEEVEDEELLIECISFFIKENYEQAVVVLERCEMKKIDLPTLYSGKRLMISLIESLNTKQFRPYIKEKEDTFYPKESQNAKKYYKRKRCF